MPFAVEAIEFAAFFNAPAAGSVLQQGTPVRVNVDFVHNRLSAAERAAAFVTVTSSIQGELSSGGSINLAPATDFNFDLAEGTHILTARVFAGGRIAQASTTVTVQAKFVSSTLVAPVRDLVAIPGENVSMAVAASGGNGAIPQVRWFMDGREFPSNWPGYGEDPASPSRLSLNFGSFDPGAFPFDDETFWNDGPHVIEVSVAADDVDPGLGCVTLGTRAQCRAFQVQVARDLRVISSNTTIGAGTTDVWSGVVRLQAVVTVNGGTLAIQPGTRVLVDMRDVNNPQNQINDPFARGIIVTSGALRIGDAGNVTPVVIETLRSFANTRRYVGIRSGGNTTNDRAISVQNAILRDAGTTLSFPDIDLNAPGRELVIADVVFEDSDNGINVECPTAFERVTARRITSTAFRLQLKVGCPGLVQYSDLTVEGASTGIFLETTTAPIMVEFSGLDVAARDTGLRASTLTSVVIDDSRFSGVTTTNAFLGAIVLEGADDVVITNSVFENNTFSFVSKGANLASLDMRGNRFTGGTRSFTFKALRSTAVVEIHGNTFEGVSSIGTYESGNLDIVNMQGNFIGAFDVSSSAAAAVKRINAGTVPTVITQITDILDNQTTGSDIGRIRIDNPLPSTALPVAIIREPNESDAWNTRQCIPFVAVAVGDDDVDALCAFHLTAPGSQPGDDTAVSLDAQGCLVNPTDGTFDVHLVCDSPTGQSTHTSRLFVDSQRFSGPIHPAGDTWSGTIVVDGDVVVPAGTTLTVATGADIRFKAGDRTLHKRVRAPISSSFDANRIRGSVQRSDVFVDGELIAVGATATPVRWRADVGTQKNTWSGFIVISGGRLELSDVAIESAVDVIVSDGGVNATLIPTYSLTNIDVTETSAVVSGVCPNSLTGLSADRIDTLYNCAGTASIELSDVSITGFNSAPTGSWMSIDDLPGATVPQLTVRGLDGVGNPTNRRRFLALAQGTGTVTFEDVSLSNVDRLVQLASGTQTFNADGLSVDNFGTLIDMGNDDVVNISDAILTQGARLLDGALGRSTWTGVRTVGVTNPFRATTVSQVVQLDVNASQFEGATTVFEFAQNFNAAGATTFNLSGNNFIGTTGRVLTATGNGINSIGTTYDLRGSHFDTADRSTILTLIEDNRTDANPNDDIDGRSDFSNFSAQPLSLVLP